MAEEDTEAVEADQGAEADREMLGREARAWAPTEEASELLLRWVVTEVLLVLLLEATEVPLLRAREAGGDECSGSPYFPFAVESLFFNSLSSLSHSHSLFLFSRCLASHSRPHTLLHWPCSSLHQTPTLDFLPSPPPAFSP